MGLNDVNAENKQSVNDCGDIRDSDEAMNTVVCPLVAGL